MSREEVTPVQRGSWATGPSPRASGKASHPAGTPTDGALAWDIPGSATRRRQGLGVTLVLGQGLRKGCGGISCLMGMAKGVWASSTTFRHGLLPAA